MEGRARRWLRAAGVNWAVLFAVLTTVVRGVTGPLIALLIAIRFSPPLQGYYYTFGSVIALQLIVEMGLGQVLTQFASHEVARLQLGPAGALSGDPKALSRLRSLARVALRWYALGGLVITLGLGAAGAALFTPQPELGLSWEGPWIALCVIAGLRFPCFAAWSLLEGCDQVKPVNAYRMIEAFVTGGATCAVILMNGGLWATVATAGAGLACGLVFFVAKYRRFFADLLASPGEEAISWKREVWPFQWRMALSFIAGYFAFSLFTPVLFHFHGSAIAGRMGMTWSFAMALSTVASAWVQTRVPTFGMLISGGRYAELDRLFFRVSMASLGVAVLGAIVIGAGVFLLNHLGHPFAGRLLPPLETALFLTATVLMQGTVPLSAYLRAHKKEPFLVLSVVTGGLVALSTIGLGFKYGPLGMAIGYLAVVSLFSLPVGMAIWYRRRREWQAAAGA